MAAAAFFHAIALGRMSIASPLLACGSVLAFGIAVAAGERPSLLAFVGAPIALGGIVLVSLEEHASGGARRSALTFALVAPIAPGGYLYLLGRASNSGGSVSAALGARIASVAVLVLIAAAIRASFRLDRLGLGLTALMGLVTTGTLVLYGYAADLGLISVASVLASLYPIVTVLLAYVFAGERLRPLQLAGVAFALAGVALVTVG